MKLLFCISKIFIPLLLTFIFGIDINAQDSLHLVGTITGETTQKNITDVKGIGDVNGDGYDDFIVSLQNDNTALLYFGSHNLDLSSDVAFHYPGEENLFAQFGRAARIGDVNGDGYDDFTIFGFFGDWGYGKGKVFLYYGGKEIDTIPANEFNEQWIEDSFGYQTTGVGDINKDGYDDFAIGSSYNFSNTKGYVYLFWGGDTVSWERSNIFKSDIAADFFGTSTASIGDINKDGFDDIAISATAWTSGQDTAKVYVYYGSYPMDANADTILVSNKGAYEFGKLIRNAGDLNKDKTIDFLIGSGSSDVSLYFGIDSFINFQGFLFGLGGYINMEAGFDINNDGFDDFLIGNTNYLNTNGVMAGGAFVYLGQENVDTINAFKCEGETHWGKFSQSMSYADINSDEYDDIIILAPDYPDYENPLGKIYIYSYNRITGIKEYKINLPSGLNLYQNFPNPFNPSTTISYDLPRISSVELKIYDILGHEVKSFIISSQTAGTQNILWDGTNSNNEQVSSGVYLYHFKAVSIEDKNEVFEKSGKLVMMK